MRLVAKYQIESILKRTAAKLFKTAKEGDIVSLEYTVNGGYKSSPMIDVYINGHYIGDGYPHQIKDVMDRAFRYKEIPKRWKFERGLTDITCPKCEAEGREVNQLWQYDRGEYMYYECDLLACDYSRKQGKTV